MIDQRAPRQRDKIHLHDEQFDGALHAACCRLDRPAGDPRIVSEETFAIVSAAYRCKRCTRNYWPLGGPE